MKVIRRKTGRYCCYRCQNRRDIKCLDRRLPRRNDLYAIKTGDALTAMNRLKWFACLKDWRVVNKKMIVPRPLLRIFHGLPLRKARMVSRRRLRARLRQWMSRRPRLKTDGWYSAAYECTFSVLRMTLYFPAEVYHSQVCLKSFAMAVLYHMERRLFFKTTNNPRG